MLDISALTNAVAEQTTVATSVEALLTNLTTEIQTLINESGNSVDPAALQDLVNKITANNTSLQNAVTSNSPAPIPTPKPTQAATPTFSPAAGPFISPQSVALASATPGAVILFTVDGSTPTDSSPAYTSPISVASTTTINAITTATGFTDSAVASAVFTISAPTP